MSWVTLTVPTQRSGDVTVRAFPTRVPGLVVIPPGAVPGDQDWSLTHVQSGGSVGMFADPETAQRVALELADLADWTVDGTTIRKTCDGAEVAHRIFELGGWRGKAPVVPDALIAARGAT